MTSEASKPTKKPAGRVDSYDWDAPTPQIGSTWWWEHGKPHAEEAITVEEVRWNGEEWWVRTKGRSGSHLNDLSRFWQAVTPR